MSRGASIAIDCRQDGNSTVCDPRSQEIRSTDNQSTVKDTQEEVVEDDGSMEEGELKRQSEDSGRLKCMKLGVCLVL